MAAPFSAFEQDFLQFTSEIVWRAATTVIRAGRPRSRVPHPIWQMLDSVPPLADARPHILNTP